MKRYRLGIIGFAHMHINELTDGFAALPNVEWVACADTKPAVPSISMDKLTRGWNLRRAVEKLGIPKVYDDYREMLAAERFDIVIFCPENARHGEVAEAIAAHGAHMITEKPMAASLSDGLRMARAARGAGVSLLINWPTTWSPAVRKAMELARAGAVGEIWELKWRNGASLGPMTYGDGMTDQEKGAEWWHQSAPGGGALLDYCCYGACLSTWLFGNAVAAQGMKANLRSPYGDAEDNAVITVRYPKSLAILEGTWSTFHSGVPTGPIFYGSEGTIVVNRGKVQVYRDRKSAEPTEVCEGDPLPAGRESFAREMLHHLETGEPLHPTLDLPLNLAAMAVLDAGIRSAASGKLELVNDAAWCIG